jgi:hypothetical protein
MSQPIIIDLSDDSSDEDVPLIIDEDYVPTDERQSPAMALMSLAIGNYFYFYYFSI